MQKIVNRIDFVFMKNNIVKKGRVTPGEGSHSSMVSTKRGVSLFQVIGRQICPLIYALRTKYKQILLAALLLKSFFYLLCCIRHMHAVFVVLFTRIYKVTKL